MKSKNPSTLSHLTPSKRSISFRHACKYAILHSYMCITHGLRLATFFLGEGHERMDIASSSKDNDRIAVPLSDVHYTNNKDTLPIKGKPQPFKLMGPRSSHPSQVDGPRSHAAQSFDFKTQRRYRQRGTLEASRPQSACTYLYLATGVRLFLDSSLSSIIRYVYTDMYIYITFLITIQPIPGQPSSFPTLAGQERG
jgi:hypothetical protein